MKGKKIYIAGGITGVPDYKEHFAKAEEYLISRGAIPMNPARMSEGFEWKDYLHICLTMIDVCEAVYLLNGWYDSAGARAEWFYADLYGKDKYYEDLEVAR